MEGVAVGVGGWVEGGVREVGVGVGVGGVRYRH